MSWKYCPRCGNDLIPRVGADGTEHLGCGSNDCSFVHYDNPTPVVAAVVEYGDYVVLVRNVGWPDDWYGLVTGFLERGEPPEEGILREIEEELGVQGELVDFIGLYTFEMMNQLIVAYHVTIEDEPTPGPELADLKKVPTAKLRPWPMATGHAVKDWLATRES